MAKLMVGLSCLLLWCASAKAGEVLIVADEIPAMQVLASKLKLEENIRCRIVTQTNMPAALAKYPAIIVYIHRGLDQRPERAFIDYANRGGKLILLHHSISSGKAANQYWFPFLGVALPKGTVEEGGYKWIEPVTLQIVNLAPEHYITTHHVNYSESIPYSLSSVGDGDRPTPGFTLKESEVYLNHHLIGPRTILLGLQYTDAKSHKTYRQNHAGWFKPAGKGWVIYLMPGHSLREFEDPAYSQIVANAVTFKP